MTYPVATYSDICWTLFYSNTTLDFLDFCLSQDENYSRLKRRFRLPLMRQFNLLLFRLMGRDLFREKAVACLKGKTREELLTEAERFYQQYLVPRKIDEIWDFLHDTHPVLLSGTLDIIAEVVALHIGAQNYHASPLLFDENNRCTGRFRDFLLQKSSLADMPEVYDYCTDNLTDLPLVRSARRALIVEYHNQQRWQKHLTNKNNITYIHARTDRY